MRLYILICYGYFWPGSMITPPPPLPSLFPDNTISLTTFPTILMGCYLTPNRLRHTGWPLCLNVCAYFIRLCVWAHACATLCVQRAHCRRQGPAVVWRLEWHEETGFEWHVLFSFPGHNIHHRLTFIYIFFNHLTFTLYYQSTVQHELLVSQDGVPVLQYYRKTCRPLQEDICDSQQHCQHHSTRQIVNVISPVRLGLYLFLILAPVHRKLWLNYSGKLCLPKIWPVLSEHPEAFTAQRLLFFLYTVSLQPAPKSWPQVFLSGISPPGVWYAGV